MTVSILIERGTMWVKIRTEYTRHPLFDSPGQQHPVATNHTVSSDTIVDILAPVTDTRNIPRLQL
jgi:hypothetical protein